MRGDGRRSSSMRLDVRGLLLALALALAAPPCSRALQYGEREHERTLVTREVSIKQGRLQGLVLELQSPRLAPVDAFLGVPYALAPTGSKRFVPPSAPPTWEGLRLAHNYAPACPQRTPNMQDISDERYNYLKRLLPYLANTSEDCLYLNIYAPQQESPRSREKFPVLVFIHGESYEWNSGNPYDGTTLASFGRIIVITLNFRLGILGFLRPEFGLDAASNLGLLDQIAALQWIKDNIAAFDGDPTNVTLMGHDTGAACVNLLLVSPITEQGLFQRAILMSGSALSDWALTANPSPITVQVADALNCPTQHELLPCLRRRRLDDLMAVHVEAPPFVTPFGPVVDGTYVPNDPEQTMGVYSSLFSRYDLMYGVTQIESYHLFGKEALLFGILEKVRLQTLKDYMLARFQIRPDLAVAEAQALYSGAWDAPSNAEDHRDKLLQMLTDARVVAPVVRTGNYHSRVNDKSYFYVFTHRTLFGDYANSKPYGSISGEELAYVFGAPLEGGRHQHPHAFTPSEKLLSENIMTLWTNFAKTGNPNLPHQLLSDEAIEWPKYDRDGQRYLQIDERLTVGKQYRRRYMDFWNYVLPEKLNKSSRESLGYPNTMAPFGPKPEDPDVAVSPPWSPPPVYPPPRRRPLPPPRPPPRPRDPYYPDVFRQPQMAGAGSSAQSGGRYGERTAVVNDPPEHKAVNASLTESQHHPADGAGGEAPAESEDAAPAGALAGSSSLALTVVILIGVCFLLVNMCAFAAIYYQRDKLRVQQQLMRSRYEDVAALATSDEEDGAERYVRKKPDTARVATVDRRVRRKKDLAGVDDDYEAIRSAGRTVDGEAAAVVVASAAEELPLTALPATSRRSAWGMARQYSGSTMDPHTKVREWIAQEIVQRYSPRFLRRAKKGDSHAPVLQSSQSIQTSFDQVSTSTTTPRHLTRQHAVETADVAISATPAEIPRQGILRAKPKKVSVAVDATPSARGSGTELSMSKSMDELGTCVSTSMLTLRKPALKRSLTLAEDLAAVSASVSPRSSSSGELLSRSTANISLKYTQPTQKSNPDIVIVEHTHSKSDPVPYSKPYLATRQPESLRSGISQPIGSQAVNISLDPHTSPSVIYVPGHKKQTLQTFPAGIQLRSKAILKKDAAVTAAPVPVDVNVTSRDSKEEDAASTGDPLSNIQKRKFPKVLPDFPQGGSIDETEMTASQIASAKRRSLPPNSHLIPALIPEVPCTPPSPSGMGFNKDIPGKPSLLRVPPPPPPRISSTLGRKPTNNAPISPLPTIPSGAVPVHAASESNTPLSEAPAVTTSGQTHYQRIEPRVIIKPTITSPQVKKAQAARGLQSIPRVTPNDPVTHPAPGPPPQISVDRNLHTDQYSLPQSRHQAPGSQPRQIPSTQHAEQQTQPSTLPSPVHSQNTHQQSALAFVAPQQKGTPMKSTSTGKQAPTSPGKKRMQPVLKVVAETSTDPMDDTDSSTGTVRRVKPCATKPNQGQSQVKFSPPTKMQKDKDSQQGTAVPGPHPSQSTQHQRIQRAAQGKPSVSTACATTSTTGLEPQPAEKTQPPKKWYTQYQQSFMSKSKDDDEKT